MINNGPRITIALLAAGHARRFGSSKQLSLYRGKPLVAWSGNAVANCHANTAVVVAPRRAARIIDAVRRYCHFTIVNDDSDSGIGDSIALATRTLGRVSDAILVVLADQPLITSDHLNCLIRTWDRTDNAIVATAYAETIGPPILFPCTAFEALGQLTGDVGAKVILQDQVFTVTTVRFEPAAFDVDTPHDLEMLP